jgi:hypothetical protein
LPAERRGLGEPRMMWAGASRAHQRCCSKLEFCLLWMYRNIQNATPRAPAHPVTVYNPPSTWYSLRAYTRKRRLAVGESGALQEVRRVFCAPAH